MFNVSIGVLLIWYNSVHALEFAKLPMGMCLLGVMISSSIHEFNRVVVTHFSPVSPYMDHQSANSNGNVEFIE